VAVLEAIAPSQARAPPEPDGESFDAELARLAEALAVARRRRGIAT
jgi:hypothetical protein